MLNAEVPTTKIVSGKFTGEGMKATADLQVVILQIDRGRQYYLVSRKEYGADDRPRCSSRDGLVPIVPFSAADSHGRPALNKGIWDNCAGCPKNRDKEFVPRNVRNDCCEGMWSLIVLLPETGEVRKLLLNSESMQAMKQWDCELRDSIKAGKGLLRSCDLCVTLRLKKKKRYYGVGFPSQQPDGFTLIPLSATGASRYDCQYREHHREQALPLIRHGKYKWQGSELEWIDRDADGKFLGFIPVDKQAIVYQSVSLNDEPQRPPIEI